MASYLEMNKQELKIAYTLADEAYNKCLNEHLKLDMSRGKPGKEQQEIVIGLFSVLQTGADCVDDGIDARNYGELAGLPCARRYWAEILGCRENEVFVGGNSSLNFMFDVISKA